MEDSARAPKACTACAKAKVRCDPEPLHGVCKRCHRLNKDCTMQPPGAHRRKARKMDVARLEEKLDSMAAILTASERRGVSGSREMSGHSPMPSWLDTWNNDIVANANEAQVFIEIYRAKMAAFFPFIVIPAHVTAEDFRQKRPLLYRAVMMVACQDAARQLVIGDKVKDYLVEHIMVNGEQSLDLLQGLLVYLAWYHFHWRRNPQLINFLYLTMAQLTNLGLNKEVKTQDSSGPTTSYLKEFATDHTLQEPRTLEERRAFLGCYYLVTILSMCLRELEPMPYTKYADDSCRAVEEAAEDETDAQLLHLVRLARMAERIHRTLSSDETESLSLSTPVGMTTRWLRGELQQLKSSLPTDTPQASILLLHYHTVELLLYRIAVNGDLPDTKFGHYAITRFDMLFSCLESARFFFDTFYSLPLKTSYFKMPYTCWSQFGHALVILSRLSLYKSEGEGGGWDYEYVRSTMNFHDTVDTFAGKLEEAFQSVTPQAVPTIFTHFSSRIRAWKDAHGRRQAARTPVVGAETIPAALDFVPDMGVNDMLMLGSMWEFFDGLV